MADDVDDDLSLAPLTLRERIELLDAKQWAAGAAAVVALAAAVWVFFRGSPPRVEDSIPYAAGAAPVASAEPAAAVSTTVAEVVVHAAGAVNQPGVYRLPNGARVADLIDVAGGATTDADLDQLNLAARLEDGARVRVPRRGEVLVEPVPSGPSSGAPAILDLNTATAEQLDALPGIGPSTAKAIIDFRTTHGRFRSVEQLLEVRGIGEAKLEQLRPHLRVAS